MQSPPSALPVAQFCILALIHQALLFADQPPSPVSTPSSSGSSKAVVSGTAPWSYASVPNWGMPDRGNFPGPTHGGVAVGNDGRIYASTDNARGILVFNPEGILLKSIAPECRGCHSLTIREEGGKEYLYAAHLLGNRAVKLTTDGEIVWSISAPMESGLYDSPDTPVLPPPSNANCPYSGKPVDPAFSVMLRGVKVCFSDVKGLEEFNSHPEKQAEVIAKLGLKAPPARRVLKPTSVTVAPDGSVFVADGYGASVIHRYSPDLRYIGTIKEAGGMPLKCPHSVVVDTRSSHPTLMVCDRANKRIIRLSLDGTFLGEISKGLPLPSTLAFFGDKTAVTELQGRVDILDSNGKVISTLGENPDKKQGGNFGVPPEAWQEGIFTAPHGICFDKSGNLYVTDWNRWGRISRLDRLIEKAQ